MRRSELERAVKDEFGAHGPTLIHALVLADVGGRTPIEALDAGIPPRDIGLALCVETDVPAERRYGVGRLEPRRG
jgi:hypothetical protein